MNLGVPKTPHSIRTIPLTHRAVAVLHKHHAIQTAKRLKEGPSWNPQDLVFCTLAGTPISKSVFRRRQYIPTLQKAGLHYIRPHDLRHTAATLLFLEGVPPLVVSEMLGHASPTFTMSVYGHVQAQMREKARDTMERLFAENPQKFS
jgi:integrase